MTRRTPDRDGHPARRAVAVGLAIPVAVALVATGCSTGGLPEPVTTQGEKVVQVWQVFLWGAVAVAALIWLLVLYAIVSSARRRRADPDALPTQTQYRTKLELVYTAVPLLIVIGLFALTLWGTQALNDRSATPDLEVEVIGFQWQWQFYYPSAGVRTGGSANVLPELHVPVGSTVRFHLSADDVIHSFWVPEFLEKRDLIPGVATNDIDVLVKQPGRWTGRCAEYCGLNHWEMKFTLVAEPKADFDAWLAAQPKGRPIVQGTFTTEGIPAAAPGQSTSGGQPPATRPAAGPATTTGGQP